MNNVKPTSKQTVVEATAESLRKTFAPRQVVVQDMSMEAIHQAILAGKIDIFISSAGHAYRLQRRYGIRVLGSLIMPGFPDPNRVDGTAIIVPAKSAWSKLEDLKGARLAVNFRGSYTGWQIPMGEVAKIDPHWERFFSSVEEEGEGEGIGRALDAVVAGRVDVAFAKNCLLEKWEEAHPEKKGLLKVLAGQDREGEPCRYSTELYPSWIVAATARMAPEDVRRAMIAVFSMPPDVHGNYWGAATDFIHIDRLFKRLQIESYEYLREWTVKRFCRQFWPWLMLAAFAIVALAAHSRRSDYLVRRRTAELKALMKRQSELQDKAREATEHLDQLQKTGALGQVSGMLAHEMRQPLAVISFYLQGLQMLVERGVVGPKVKLEAPLSEIERQTRKADLIVEHVRSYARNSRKGGHRKPSILAEVVREAVSNYRLSRRRPPRIEEQLEENLWAVIDPLEIECALFNLLKNAGEALEKVRDPRVRVTLSRAGAMALVSVEDNGPALPQAEFERLGSPAESGKEEGLGLGLSIVRSLIEAYGGKLTFARRAEGGLIASFTLPISEGGVTAGNQKEKAS